MSAFEMYLIMQMDSIRGVFVGVLFPLGMAALATCVFAVGTTFDEDIVPFRGAALKTLRYIGAAFIASIIGLAVIPSTQTLLVAYGVSSVTQIDGVEKLPEKSVQALDKMLSDYLSEKD